MDDRLDRDRGSTLLEVMVTMIMLGIITSVVAFAITTVLRVTPTTQSDIDDARSLQGLTSRFPADISSAPETGVTLSPVSLTCIGSEAASGINLLQLQWTADESPSVDYVAAYRSEPEGDGRAVRRYACSSAAGFNDTAQTTLTAPLSATPPTVTAVPASGLVRMELQSLDGTPITVEGTTRAATQALPTTTTSPTVPPPACSIAFNDAPFAPVGRHPSSHLTTPDELLTNVPITVTVAGSSCGPLTLVYDPDVDNMTPDIVQPITVSGTTGSVTIPGAGNAGSVQWIDLSHDLEVFDNGFATGVIEQLDVT